MSYNKSAMTRTVSWLLLLILFGTLGVVVARALRARAAVGKDMPAFSIYSEEADGLGPAGHLLRALGWEPVAVTRPIQNTRHRGLLVLVEPEVTRGLPGHDAELPETHWRGLLRWVEQGNTLLYCGRQMTGLHRELEVVVTTDERVPADEVRAATVDEGGGYTAGIESLAVEARHTLRASAGLPLWWVGDQPGAVLLRRGQGRVVFVADPTILTARGLRREDNVLFLVNAISRDARDGRVYFDEYHHGLRSGGGFWGYLHYHEQHLLVLQVLLVTAVAGWSVMVRLGPARPRPRERQADAVDYASALARIYEYAGARRHLARTLAQGFLATLTRHLRLRRGAATADILAAWRRREPGRSATEMDALLRGLDALRQGAEVSERQLLEWSQTLDQLEREVLRGR